MLHLRKEKMKRFLIAVFVVLFSTCPALAQQDLQISLKGNTEKEQQKKNQVEKLLKQYKPSKWIFTKNILIDEQTRIPHSHPVLTLNTNQLDNDLATLSTFIHEQLHWFEEANPTQRDKAI